MRPHQTAATRVLQEMNQHQRQLLEFSLYYSMPKLERPLQCCGASQLQMDELEKRQIHLAHADQARSHLWRPNRLLEFLGDQPAPLLNPLAAMS